MAERFPPVFVTKKIGTEEFWIQSTLGDMRLMMEPRHARWLINEGIIEKWGGNHEVETFAFSTKANLVDIKLLVPRLALTQFVADGTAQRIAVQAAAVSPTKVIVTWPDNMPETVEVEVQLNIVEWRPARIVEGSPPGNDN